MQTYLYVLYKHVTCVGSQNRKYSSRNTDCGLIKFVLFFSSAEGDAEGLGNSSRFVAPPPSLLRLSSLSHVGLVQQLDFLAITRVVPRLPQAVLPVRLHRVGDGDVDALHLRVAAAGD